MHINLEIQNMGHTISYNDIVNLVKNSMKKKNIPVSKVKNMKAYYVSTTRVIYYTGTYNNEELKGEIYL